MWAFLIVQLFVESVENEFLYYLFCFSLKIWVYGDSFKSMLVAVVVPCEEDTKKWAYSNGHTASFLELCSLGQLQNYILSELKNAAEKNKVVLANWNTSCVSL